MTVLLRPARRKGILICSFRAKQVIPVDIEYSPSITHLFPNKRRIGLAKLINMIVELKPLTNFKLSVNYGKMNSVGKTLEFTFIFTFSDASFVEVDGALLLNEVTTAEWVNFLLNNTYKSVKKTKNAS